MAKQTILRGTVQNDGTGSSLYIASGIINSNFTELYPSRNAQAVNYAMTIADTLVGVTSTGSPRTITLPPPASVSVGLPYIIKDEGGGAVTNNITVARNAAESIDGVAANIVINTNYGFKRLYSNGINWFTI